MKERVKHGCIAIVLLMVIAILSCRAYDGWKQEEKRSIYQLKMRELNLLEKPIGEVFQRINKVVTLPSMLYVEKELIFSFDNQGELTGLTGSLYGKSEGKTYSFSYDRGKSNILAVRIEKLERAHAEDGRSLDPLLVVDSRRIIQDALKRKKGNEYCMRYQGFCAITNEDGDRYWLDQEGTPQEIEGRKEMNDYFASIEVVADKKEKPAYYVLTEGGETALEEVKLDEATTSFLDKQIGYRLTIMDVALGQKCYALEKTEDGGVTFTRSVIQLKEPYQTFCNPEKVTKEDKTLVLLVTEENRTGKKARFVSKDEGKTWTFLEEVEGNEEK